MELKAIDLHSHYSTKKGYLWQAPKEIGLAEKFYRYEAKYRTEEEMAQDFRDAGVKVILDLGFTQHTSIEEAKELHDYVGHLILSYHDVIIGGWVALNPRTGLKGLRELERGLKDLGMTGFAANPTSLNIAPSDEVFYPFYEMCIEAKAPVLLNVGFTAVGANQPGGGGRCLDYCHPRYIDEVAAKFPELIIIAGRQAWPWVNDMIATLLHKPNVWNELHGWSPKYLAPELKWDIGRRLQDKIMFGADYPMFDYERLFRDWESEGYKQDILEKVYYKNAQKLFRNLGRELV